MAQVALLFYSLLVGNPIFLDTTLARADVELFFLPVLHQLYHTDKVQSPRQLYLLVIILLILSQDSAFNVGKSKSCAVAGSIEPRDRVLCLPLTLPLQDYHSVRVCASHVSLPPASSLVPPQGSSVGSSCRRCPSTRSAT
jgi:hypothetical protein